MEHRVPELAGSIERSGVAVAGPELEGEMLPDRSGKRLDGDLGKVLVEIRREWSQGGEVDLPALELRLGELGVDVAHVYGVDLGEP